MHSPIQLLAIARLGCLVRNGEALVAHLLEMNHEASSHAEIVAIGERLVASAARVQGYRDELATKLS